MKLEDIHPIYKYFLFLFLSLIAYCSIKMASYYIECNNTAIVGIIGTGIILSATIGRLYSFKSLGGKTPYEKWDRRIYLILSIVGVCLIMFSIIE